MRKIIVAACIFLLTGSMTAFADAVNDPPPAGAILDLNGLPISGSAEEYTVNFTAALSSTAITFAFRNDPDFISFSEASVTDLTTSSGNLLQNGDFSTPINSVTDWSYANIYGATYGGVVNGDCGVGGSNCWYDGAVQAYDAISQTIVTTSGDLYQISFYVSAGGGSTFSDLSTNGDTTDTDGNGIDVLAYAQAGLPVAGGTTPEPSSIVLLSTGLAALAGALRRKLAVK